MVSIIFCIFFGISIIQPIGKARPNAKAYLGFLE